ncbi:MAG: hypothetical protein KME17_06340 [Cyanosarcina radialis HA8281-LM2]|jgi:hypothetical protein|nr:hypothetical protein [Cyanosarcina radialis HA8281-LM2]
MDPEWEGGQTLPNVEEAEIDVRKFEQYSLNPENPNNQGKWMAFAAIGYEVNSPQGRQIATEDIIEQLRTKLPHLLATQEEPSIYGLRFEVQVTIRGLNGKEGNLITKWQIDRGKTKPRLISNWLKFPQSREMENES